MTRQVMRQQWDFDRIRKAREQRTEQRKRSIARMLEGRIRREFSGSHLQFNVEPTAAEFVYKLRVYNNSIKPIFTVEVDINSSRKIPDDLLRSQLWLISGG